MNTNTKNLLQSKRFWTAVATVITMIITSYLPAALELQALIITLTGIVGYGVINGFSKQDVELARAEIAKELAKGSNVDRAVKGIGSVVDALESAVGIDLPDTLEEAGKAQVRQLLQRLADKFGK